jgi:hypothetical protein
MDSTRFDDLLRAFALGLSRRATLGAALSTLFATGSLALVADDTEAKKGHKKKKKKKKCKGNTKKCGKKCIPTTSCCSSADCGGGGATCQGGTCLCPTGQQDCDGACIPDDDCCPACTGGQVCVAETCACPANQQECDGECIPETDCCPACSGGAICDGGVCVCGPENPTCGEGCCDAGADEVCRVSPSNEVCEGGGCPPSNFCVDEDYFRCGPGGCSCITSVEDANACSDVANVDCTDCTSDQQCTTALGQDALCIPAGPFCTSCSGNTNFCVATGCPSGGGGTCEEETDYCIDPETFQCGAGCVCTNTVDPAPEHACVQIPPLNPPDCVTCTSSAGCGTGEVCIASGQYCGQSCGAAFCRPLCAEGALMAAARSGSRSLKDASAAKGSGGTRRERQRRGNRKRGGHRQHHRS